MKVHIIWKVSRGNFKILVTDTKDFQFKDFMFLKPNLNFELFFEAFYQQQFLIRKKSINLKLSVHKPNIIIKINFSHSITIRILFKNNNSKLMLKLC